MSLDGVYDRDNVFARIVRSEMPCARVFEDDQTLAFMDVFPQGRGHVLVIHKSAVARNLMDVEPYQLGAIMTTVQRLTRAVRDALKPDGVMVAQFNGAAAGQTVYHLHVHVIPRWVGQPLGRHAAGGMADPKDLAQLAALIGAAVK